MPPLACTRIQQHTAAPRGVASASTQPARPNVNDGAAAPSTAPANDAPPTLCHPAPQRPVDSIDPFCMLNGTHDKVFFPGPLGLGPFVYGAWGQRD